MKLIDLLKKLPDNMQMKNHVYFNKIKTVKEWKKEIQHEKTTGYELYDSKCNYEKTTLKVIYYPGAGRIFTECK